MMRILFIGFFLVGCATSPTDSPEAKKPDEKTKNAAQIPKQKIRATFVKHHRYIRNCYGKILTKPGHAKAAGKVLLGFEVGPDGRALNPMVVKERSSLVDDNLNKCLFAGITSWDWPVAPNGEVTAVKYPLVFSDKPPKNMNEKLDAFEKLRNQ